MRSFLRISILATAAWLFSSRVSASDESQAGEQGSEASEARQEGEPHARRAVRLGHEGLKRYSEGHYAEALHAFAQADSLAHSPVFVLYRARASRKLGDLLGARTFYRQCAQEEVSESTPATWKKAVADAVAELDSLNSEIPRLSVVAQGDFTFPVRVQFRGRTEILKEPEVSFELNPGLVEIRAQDATGTVLSTALFVVMGSRTEEVTLSFPRLTQVMPTVKSTGPSLGGEDHRAAPKPYRSGAHAAFLVGGAALIFGTVSAIVAARQAQDLKSRCDGSRCQPEDKELARSAINWANTATAAYVSGAVGVATGVGLLFWPSGVGVKGEF